MQRRIALKRLTASDLTLFEWQFRNRNAGNQKSINLNTDVFIDELFPALPAVAAESNDRIPVDLSIYGPGHSGLHNLQRKILKGRKYKNWRLDGEYINNPENEPERYNVLQPDDLAVFEFLGPIVPNAAKLILVARDLPADEAIYRVLVPLVEGPSMVSLSANQLASVVNGLNDDDHPFHQLTLDAELEDVALGGTKALASFRRRRGSRPVSREDLERAHQAANQAGVAGEELVFHHLDHSKADGTIADVRWEADVNAVAPYDFLVTMHDSQEIAIDVKTTTGEFDRPIHISYGELVEMTRQRRYDIYRVFEVTDSSGKLCIVENVGAFASMVLQGLAGLPADVAVDSVSVRPSSLPFGSAQSLDVTVSEEPEAIG